jgi:NADH dehydrogenase
VVDYFRVKHRVEDIVRASGVPWVIVRPSAFMDVWTGVLFGNLERPAAVATVFGRGDRVVNYISIDDVTSFVLAVLGNAAVQDEIIDIGGPSEVNFIEFSSAIQRAMGVPAKRRHVPAGILGVARHVARPFNEVAARFASLGYFTTLSDRRFPEWRTAAVRFSVEPITIEQFAKRYAWGRFS